MPKSSVFISYSSKDKKWVKEYLLKKLEEKGIPCHIDFRDFDIGIPALINMERAVEISAKTILVLTPDWVKSDFANFEGLMLQTDDPIGLKKRIFPIMLRNCEPPKRLKIFTYADFTNESEWDTQMKRVIKQIKKDLELSPDRKTYPALDPKHIEITRLPQTGFELFGRHKELTILNEVWASSINKGGNPSPIRGGIDETRASSSTPIDDEAWAPTKTNILSFVAYGGVGKSTLINKWVEKMRWDQYRGAEKVYA